MTAVLKLIDSWPAAAGPVVNILSVLIGSECRVGMTK